MATSLIRKTEKVIRNVASATGAGGARVRIPLNKESLISEHKVIVAVSQANSGTDPASVDVRKFITNMELQTSDGKRFTGDGALAYDLSRLTEGAAAAVTSLGATSTAKYSFDLHHENDGALYDLLSAIKGETLSQLDLVIDLASDSDNGFLGQTSPAAAAYTITVESKDYPDMAHMSGVGELKHFVESQTVNGTTTGRQADIRLASGNATRFITIHAYDTTGVAVGSDAVLDAIRLVINGKEKRVTTWRSVRDETAMARGLDVTGFGVLDWGDDEGGFLDLNGVNDPRLQVDVAASGAPAAWRLVIGQDFTTK